MNEEQLAEQYAENIELDTKWNNPRQVIEQAYITGYNEAQNTITQCNRSALSGGFYWVCGQCNCKVEKTGE